MIDCFLMRSDCTQEKEEQSLYNVGDTILVKADRSLTPFQRFWVCQIMNITRSHTFPDINDADPQPIVGAPRWFKVWWFESKKEFGVYKKSFHAVDGAKTPDLSWESESNAIIKLMDGLTKRGTIRAYPNYMKHIKYELKKAFGDLHGEEELAFEILTDDMTRNKAEQLISSQVTRPINDDPDEEELHFGTVVAFHEPDDDDHDRRIYFELEWDGGDKERVVAEDLNDMLV